MLLLKAILESSRLRRISTIENNVMDLKELVQEKRKDTSQMAVFKALMPLL
jgi:hypothetical protein